LRMKCRVCW